MARILGRLIRVPLALLMALLIALSVMVSIGQERLAVGMRAAPEDVLFDMFGLFFKLAAVLLTPATIILPMLVAVAGEVARIRALAYYVVSFGLMAALIPLMGRIGADAAGSAPIWAIFATAGFAGGFVYWLLAGRSA